MKKYKDLRVFLYTSLVTIFAYEVINTEIQAMNLLQENNKENQGSINKSRLLT